MVELTNPPPEEHCFSTPFDHSSYSTPTPTATASTTTTSSSSQHDEKNICRAFHFGFPLLRKRCCFYRGGPLLLFYLCQGPMQIENVTTPGLKQFLCRFRYKEGGNYWVLCFEHVCLLPFHG